MQAYCKRKEVEELTQVFIRLPECLKEMLQQCARERGLSLNAYVLQMFWTLVDQENTVGRRILG